MLDRCSRVTAKLFVAGAVSGEGTDTADGTTLEFGSSVGSSQTVTFADGDILMLDDPSQFQATIGGFSGVDSIVVGSATYSADDSVSVVVLVANGATFTT